MRILNSHEFNQAEKIASRFQGNPQATIILDDQNYCTLWSSHHPYFNNEKIGMIGNFVCQTLHNATLFLENASKVLKEQGCKKIIGPINGNTWQSYRFVTWSDQSPPFLLEPQQPSVYPEYWQKNHFTPWQEYVSTKTIIADAIPVHENKAKEINIRNIDLTQYENELKSLYEISLLSFKNNILYTPINQDEFLSLYLPYQDKINPSFVLFAHHQNTLCGYVFGVPDYYQLQYQKNIDQLIVKTLAIHPDWQGHGIGGFLVKQLEQNAFAQGYRYALHALMHQNNHSAKIGKNAEIIRKYTLFQKELI